MGVCNSKATGAQTQPGPVNTASAAKKTTATINKPEPEEDVSIFFNSLRGEVVASLITY